MTQHNQECFYALKTTMESIFGQDAWVELKHCTELNTWKKYAKKILSASKKAIKQSVSVTDQSWLDRVEEISKRGLERLKDISSLDELFQVLAATYIELSFHQIGLMPSRQGSETQRVNNWNLIHFRSVQYVQSNHQKTKLKELLDKGSIF